MIRPTITICRAIGSPAMFSPFRSTAIITAPMKVPQTLPRPPASDVPPTTAAGFVTRSKAPVDFADLQGEPL